MNAAREIRVYSAALREIAAQAQIREMQDAARAVRERIAADQRARRQALRRMQRAMNPRPSLAAAVVSLGLLLAAVAVLTWCVSVLLS